jgi:hypothetical protein
MPRFLDQPPRERLHTLLHELYHISPRFDGDLRRFPGRNEFHGDSRVDFDAPVEALVEPALREVDIARYHFLRLTFDELRAKFGSVVGAKLKRFKPRRERYQRRESLLAAPLTAFTGALPEPSGRQKSLFG